MSWCKAIVKKKWYVPEHQCRFPAQANGFCKRHDPERRLATLKRQELRLSIQLEKVRKEIQIRERLKVATLPRIKGVIGAPQWLKDRMARLAKRPPPTLEKVRAQFKASEEWDLPPWLKKGGRMAT